jgi:hypothetical protein
MIGASKSVPAAVAAAENPEADTLKSALVAFTRNAVDIESAISDSQDLFKDDPNGLAEYLAKEIKRRPAGGFLEAYKATVLGIKANEAVLARKRIEIDRALYELA